MSGSVPAPLFERFEKQDWFFILINLQWTVTASCRRVQSDHLLNRGLQVMVQDGEMNMYVRYLCVVTMLLACAGAAAQEIDLTLSDNSALFRYLKHGTSTYGQSEIDAGLLYTNDSDFLLMLGLQVQGEAGSGSRALPQTRIYMIFSPSVLAVNCITLQHLSIALDFASSSIMPRILSPLWMPNGLPIVH